MSDPKMPGMLSIDPAETAPRDIHRLMIGCIGPRPIALVSTISDAGVSNLAPFSFFNAFSSNPPVIAFSPARSGRDGRFKDTYNNLMQNSDCVVQVVTYAMVEQINLASTEYPPEVDEFVKSGLTPLPAKRVKAKRVQESPVQMECKLRQMVQLGDGKAAGNLAICDVVQFHLQSSLMHDGAIHPNELDLVARQGGDFYLRASGANVFEVPKPLGDQSLGYDQLPDFMKSSHVYSANNLGRFALSEKIPSDDEMKTFIAAIASHAGDEAYFERAAASHDYREMLAVALHFVSKRHPQSRRFVERSAKCAIEAVDFNFAWCTALYANQL